MQVGEDDYHQLKHDQCLRVDFKSFPTKFIELLESCRTTSSGGGSAVDPEAREGGGALDEGGRSTRGELLLSGGSGEPSFLARLETVVPGGFSLFSVVETNPFKELTHLSLKFRAGNDAAIKTYLAARLRQVRYRTTAVVLLYVGFSLEVHISRFVAFFVSMLVADRLMGCCCPVPHSLLSPTAVLLCTTAIS